MYDHVIDLECPYWPQALDHVTDLECPYWPQALLNNTKLKTKALPVEETF